MRYFVFFLVLTSVVTIGCKKKGCTDPAAPNYNPSVSKDDGTCEEIITVEPGPEPEIHAGYLLDDIWTADRIHILVGKVIVQSGSTLTIEPGTIIKCEEGLGTLSSALVVQSGGQIYAEGTANSPIIFTSILDNIQIGQLSGTSLNENDKGLWGGIFILGEAPISAANGDVLTEISGTPVGTDFFFGGSDPSDSSGIFKYVSIRHSGALIGSGNQCNGLTLGGVGSGTVIDHIEVVAGFDDGIQIFGGTVNVSNLVVGYPGDDGVETEMNFDGSISNGFVLLNNYSDFGIEMKGPAGQTYTNGTAELSSISILNDQGGTIRSNFSGEVKATITNVDFNGNVLLSASYESNCLTQLPDALNNLIGSNQLLFFNNCSRNSLLIDANACSIPSSDQFAAEAAFSSGSPTGADVSAFHSWTWLSVNGKL